MLNKNESISILNTADCFIIPIIVFLGIITRFWINGWPDYETFDEVHFGGFTNGYINQEYFFDIHPPLAKLLIAFVSYLSGYKGNIDFESLYSKKYFDEKSKEILIDYITLRLAPQIFSSFVPAIIYITMRILHFSIISSITSSSLLLFETSIICEGKFILTDGILHFFVSLHLLSLFYACQYPSVLSLIIDGVTLGLACSCKSTAWGLTIVDGFVHTYFIIRKYQKIIKKSTSLGFNEHNQAQKIYSKVNLSYFTADILFDIITRGSLLIFLLSFIYYISFVIHISVLRYDGPGSVFLEKSIKKTLLHSKNLDNNSTFLVEPLTNRNTGPSIFYRILYLNIEMQVSNMRIKAFHPWQSEPSDWPLLTSSYVAFINLDDDREINCIGNAFVYYISFFSILFIIVYYMVTSLSLLYNFLFNHKKNSTNFLSWRLFFIVFGYMVSYLPFFLVPRCMFLYHYQIPLIFACMAVGCVLDIIFFIPSRIKEKSLEIQNVSKVLPNFLNDEKNRTEKVEFESFKLILIKCLKSSQKINFLKAFGMLFALLIMTLAFVGFIIWYPFTYGTKITYDSFPLKLYQKFFVVENIPYQFSPHDLYRKIFIPDNWIFGDSHHREIMKKNDDDDDDDI